MVSIKCFLAPKVIDRILTHLLCITFPSIIEYLEYLQIKSKKQKNSAKFR